ncbi:MAG: TlyA family RNA methyltransferase [Anaerovoracaceae bacterium]
MSKVRIDTLLAEKGYFPSREKAKTSLMAGIVFVDNQRVDKPGALIAEDATIEIRGNTSKYVGRGGEKLEGPLKEFDIDLKEKICVDMGASTGGFTDCMLQDGAKKVYAIDVGYGQLDWKLRTDERVINIEKTNIRYMDTELIKEPADFISIDVSFISLKLILPVAAKVLSDSGKILALVKPQFEAGREDVGKGGIVKDPKVHQAVLEKVKKYAEDNKLEVIAETISPIKGTKGNTEFFLLLEQF